MNDFKLWDGKYVKEPYLALINNKVVPCWPNAGEMVSCDGSGRSWKHEHNIMVRRCTVAEHIAASGAVVPEWAKDDEKSTNEQ